ncbi:MAG: 50S ribosomal protein L9 [Thermodesulfobacteriota bacterium]|nr:50S ribosomal protein L9 [Thermodesulfobacteriota bacterium]
MKVILTQDVDTLGLAGQVVDVSKGYVRNKLVPGGLALEASPANLKLLEKKAAEYEVRAMKEKEKAQNLAGRIEALRLTISQKAGEKDKLYGSVTSMDLAAALAEQGVDMDRRKIKMPENIKTLGDYEVSVKLHSEVTAVLKVSVIKAE